VTTDANAVRIAANLCRVWGDLAVSRAEYQQHAAEEAGDHARADLLRAAHTILAARHRVFNRSRDMS